MYACINRNIMPHPSYNLHCNSFKHSGHRRTHRTLFEQLACLINIHNYARSLIFRHNPSEWGYGQDFWHTRMLKCYHSTLHIYIQFLMLISMWRFERCFESINVDFGKYFFYENDVLGIYSGAMFKILDICWNVTIQHCICIQFLMLISMWRFERCFGRISVDVGKYFFYENDV